VDPGNNTKQREPFFIQWSVENGRYLSLEGPSRVLPAEEIPYNLRIKNPTRSNWNGKFCFLLLSQQNEVERLLDGEFSIKPFSGEDIVLKAQMPGDLREEAYGLAFVIPGSMAPVTTIQIGNSMDARDGSWPEPHCMDE
jgi:hypothetical protein